MPENSRLTTPQIARWAGISTEAVRQRFRSGALAGEVVNGIWTGRAEDVAALWPDRVKGKEPPRLRLVNGGPRTELGKQRTKHNAIKLGLFAKATVIGRLGELPEEYADVRRAYVEHFQPESDLELLIVEQLVSVAWRRLRALRGMHTEVEKAWHAAQSPEWLLLTRKLDQLSIDLEKLAVSTTKPGDVDAWADRALKLFIALHPDWAMECHDDPLASKEGGQVQGMMCECGLWSAIIGHDAPVELTAGPVAEVTNRLRKWVAALVARLSDTADDLFPSIQLKVPSIDPEQQQFLDAHEHHLDRRHAALLAELKAVRSAGVPPM